LRFTATKTLTHLHHAGRAIVATLQLLDLVEEALFKPFFDSSYCFRIGLDSAISLSLGMRTSTIATADARRARRA